MCAGAIYWAGIGRLVYGLSEHRLRAVTGNHPENPTLDLPCREVFASGQRPTEVVGPLLEDEAEAVHAGVVEQVGGKPWTRRRGMPTSTSDKMVHGAARLHNAQENGAAGSSRRHRFSPGEIRRSELHRDAG